MKSTWFPRRMVDRSGMVWDDSILIFSAKKGNPIDLHVSDHGRRERYISIDYPQWAWFMIVCVDNLWIIW